MTNLLANQPLIYKDEAYKIIGAALAVHKELGCGFFEAVYSEAFALELKSQNIPFSKEVPISINYKSQILSKSYIADFVCYDKIIIELKATIFLETIHEAQVLNYLKASNFKLGLLINFGEKSLKYKRIIY